MLSEVLPSAFVFKHSAHLAPSINVCVSLCQESISFHWKFWFSIFGLPCDANTFMSLKLITDRQVGCLSTGGAGNASVSVKPPVIVQDWSQLLALGCKFLVRERQSSLLRGKLTLFLWVKRKQSLKIYLGEKTWVLTIYSTEELRERRVCF